MHEAKINHCRQTAQNINQLQKNNLREQKDGKQLFYLFNDTVLQRGFNSHDEMRTNVAICN